LCLVFCVKGQCCGFSRPLLSHFKMLLLVSRKIRNWYGNTCKTSTYILHKCFQPPEDLFLMFGLVWLGTGSSTLRIPPSRPWWGEPAKKSKVSPSHLSPSVVDPGSGAFLDPWIPVSGIIFSGSHNPYPYGISESLVTSFG
jgi:hypothetical protein